LRRKKIVYTDHVSASKGVHKVLARCVNRSDYLWSPKMGPDEIEWLFRSTQSVVCGRISLLRPQPPLLVMSGRILYRLLPQRRSLQLAQNNFVLNTQKESFLKNLFLDSSTLRHAGAIKQTKQDNAQPRALRFNKIDQVSFLFSSWSCDPLWNLTSSMTSSHPSLFAVCLHLFGSSSRISSYASSRTLSVLLLVYSCS
jgi:hypothetical protein